MTEDMNTTMLVSPNGGMGNGFGGDGWWIILLLLFAGGFGGNGFGGNNIYPWMNQADITTSGFQNAATNQAIGSLQNGLTSGFGDLQTALCGGFAGVNAAITNASINSMQNMNALQSQLAQCCCDNRLATVQTQNVVQTEGAATRLAIQNQTQEILDKLCQQEIDAKNDRIGELERQLNFANLSASQTAQTQYIIDALKPASTT